MNVHSSNCRFQCQLDEGKMAVEVTTSYACTSFSTESIQQGIIKQDWLSSIVLVSITSNQLLRFNHSPWATTRKFRLRLTRYALGKYLLSNKVGPNWLLLQDVSSEEQASIVMFHSPTVLMLGFCHIDLTRASIWFSKHQFPMGVSPRSFDAQFPCFQTEYLGFPAKYYPIALRQFRSSPSSKEVSFTIKFFPYQLYPEASKEGEDKYEWWVSPCELLNR